MNEETENTTPGQADAQTLELPAEDIEKYPLREPSEDPRWALRIIQIWICMAVALLLFFVILLILGIWYD